MASTVWKGYITFGLITIPIRLFAAARGERVGFHQIHGVCGTRIKQQTYCPHCERVVERSELVKGYEVEKDQYVIVTDEEIKSVAPASSDNMEILEFVKAEGNFFRSGRLCPRDRYSTKIQSRRTHLRNASWIFRSAKRTGSGWRSIET